MSPQLRPSWKIGHRTVVTIVVSATLLITLGLVGDTRAPNLQVYPNAGGGMQTFNTAGAIDMAAPFFQNLGTNGRTCDTCHQASDGWSVTPAHIQARFTYSQGLDPIFRPVDGANCPSADVSSLQARQSAYSMLLNKGLLRISIRVPDADFQVISVADAFQCPETTSTQLALFRRPLPSTNLPFLTTVMWDGRESLPGNTLEENLKHQALDATTGHAQASVTPTDQQLQAIVDFEMRNFTAQGFDNSAGRLGAQGATGGPIALSSQNFFVGINDPLGTNGFTSSAMTLFDAWSNLQSNANDPTNSARASIARGQALFNTFPITISGVAGLNDKPGVPSSFTGTCTTCHNTPNVGNHSVALALNIGVTDYPAVSALDTTGLPVYTIQCNNGRTVQTTDPARALITGKCADIGKTKGPILRGLAARAPYFHNGSAATLDDVLNFYEMRFGLTFTDQQRKDLIAFLNSL